MREASKLSGSWRSHTRRRTRAQEAGQVRSVGGQLAAFRREMEADGAAQRAECRRLVDAAVARAGKLVDETLQAR